MTNSDNLGQLDELIGKPQTDATLPFYRILFLEDNADDVELMKQELTEARFQFSSRQVNTSIEFIREVFLYKPDVILADYSLRKLNGIQAFHLVKKEKPMIPFILVTRVLNEQLAVECVKEGIDDFVLKSSLRRLPSSVLNAIKKKEVEQEKKRISIELERSHEELRLLVCHQQTSLEEERMKIARDLHDELGQVLTALKIDITMLWKKFTNGVRPSQEVIDGEFDSLKKLVDKTTLSVKSISSGLRPETLDTLGLLDAIRWQAIEFERRNKIACKTFLPTDSLDIDKDLSIALFRMIQESLTNVARHSGANRVDVRLETLDGVLTLEISDNGKGINASELANSRSLGIIGLRERVLLLKGKFDIRGMGDMGTKVSILIPLDNKT